MTKQKQNVFWGVAVFFFAVFFFAPPFLKDWFQPPTESAGRLNKTANLSQTPIDWTVRDINGNSVEIKKGKTPLVINLWATWCAPCIEELPSLSALADREGREGLVVAVTTESLEKVRRFVKSAFPDLSLHLKIVSVSRREQNQFFPADNLPVTYLFDRNGLLVRKVTGARDWISYPLP